MSSILPLLDLSELGVTISQGITRAQGNDLAEAAAFCLEWNGHPKGVHLHVIGDGQTSYQATWPDLPDNASAAWNDHHEATERGAVGMAILLMRKNLGYDVFMRSPILSGYDYVLRREEPSGGTVYARLEISGILRGTRSDINNRVNRKIKQVKDGESPGDDRDAYVAVVEFSGPFARVLLI